jgi:HlyD family secretion protein
MDIARPDLKARAQRRNLMLYGAAALILALLLFAASRIKPAVPSLDKASVWIDTVKRGEFVREVRGPGTLVPKEIRWIAAGSAGRVERLLIKPGARVESTSIIMELSSPELLEQLEAARGAFAAGRADAVAQIANLESQELDQQAALAGVEADEESARLQVEAEQPLVAKGVISALNFKRSQLTATRTKARLDAERKRIQQFAKSIAAQKNAQQARVDQLGATLKLREQQVAALQVQAGVSGVLQQVPVEPGQQVVIGTNLARVARPEALLAELKIAETQAKDIALDQAVKIDTRNGIVAGKVVRIDPAVLSGTVQVDVEFTENLPSGARPDLSVDGTIEIARIADTLFVGRPANAGTDSTMNLYRVGANGEANQVAVKIGQASVNSMQVLDGLREGDQVITSDTSSVSAHPRIRLR